MAVGIVATAAVEALHHATLGHDKKKGAFLFVSL
jgi:hypothetical protein